MTVCSKGLHCKYLLNKLRTYATVGLRTNVTGSCIDRK